jgi:hypothetical protein
MDAAGEPEPLPGWREVVRRPAFRAAALRQSLPVIGVFLLHWSALDIVAFFLFEVWLFLTLRVAFELTFDKPGVAELTVGRLVSELLRYALMGGVAFAFVVGMIVLVAVVPAFSGAEALEWARESWRSRSFLLALTLMVASHLWEARGFALRCHGRSDEEREGDDLRIRVMFARLVVVGLAGIFLGLAQAFGVGGRVLVLVICGAIVWLEAAPERAEAILGVTSRRAA